MKQQSSKRSLARLGILAGGIGVVLFLPVAILAPCSFGARPVAQKNACIANLRQIDGAKQQWALEHQTRPGDVPCKSDLFGANGYLEFEPDCPAGGEYSIHAVDNLPTCTREGHRLAPPTNP